jgi:outer membrane protein TolC
LYISANVRETGRASVFEAYSDNWNVGLSVSYPLSSIYKNSHKIKESKLMVSLRKNDEEQKMQRIRMDVRTAFLRHQEALQRVEALQLSVRQAQENYRIMQNRYLNQLAILTDLLDANSVRLNVELQLVTARTRVIYTYYQLQKACGRL